MLFLFNIDYSYIVIYQRISGHDFNKKPGAITVKRPAFCTAVIAQELCSNVTANFTHFRFHELDMIGHRHYKSPPAKYAWCMPCCWLARLMWWTLDRPGLHHTQAHNTTEHTHTELALAIMISYGDIIGGSHLMWMHTLYT